MEFIDPYYVVIGASITLILSYIFNLISARTNIPSVLLLILLGILLKQLGKWFGFEMGETLFGLLEILGIVGLIMIVLEAALDLELRKERWPIIWKSFLVALLGLGFSAFACAYIFQVFLDIDNFFLAMVYAVPLSIMSSAIVIPSVGGLEHDKQEFMVYESTFSDILGIMLFYFLLGNAETTEKTAIFVGVTGNIIITIALSVALSYALVLIFQKLETEVKLFLLIAVLLLLYSIGKLFHLSSLIIILVFGLILNNTSLFFRGWLKKMINTRAIYGILHNFRLVTVESAFVMRTFFFVIFGVTISIGTLLDVSVAIVSLIVVASFLLIRFVLLKLILKNDILPQLFIAPRGLITILLFFSIPEELQLEDFNSGILLFVVLITSFAMTFALVLSGTKIKPYDDFADNYWEQVDQEIDTIPTSEKQAKEDK